MSSKPFMGLCKYMGNLVSTFLGCGCVFTLTATEHLCISSSRPSTPYTLAFVYRQMCKRHVTGCLVGTKTSKPEASVRVNHHVSVNTCVPNMLCNQHKCHFAHDQQYPTTVPDIPTRMNYGTYNV